MVAHECILDLRPITKSTGVTVDDVAKRLADYGFHAPTMSFPVAGTLMVEPTESESLAEVDAFCEAMIAIRGEIDGVGSGAWPADDNPLRRAPHTAECLLVSDWITRTPVSRQPTRSASISGPRSGRWCAASTAPTATATWCARARRWRLSRSGDGVPCGASGEAVLWPRDRCAEALHLPACRWIGAVLRPIRQGVHQRHQTYRGPISGPKWYP